MNDLKEKLTSIFSKLEAERDTISLLEVSKIFKEVKEIFFSAKDEEITENSGLQVGNIFFQVIEINNNFIKKWQAGKISSPSSEELNFLQEIAEEVPEALDWLKEKYPSVISDGFVSGAKKNARDIKNLVQQEKSRRQNSPTGQEEKPNQPNSPNDSNNQQIKQLQKDLQNKQKDNQKSVNNSQQPEKGFNWLYVVIPAGVLIVVMGIVIAYLLGKKNKSE